jgi:hypothetical protein
MEIPHAIRASREQVGMCSPYLRPTRKAPAPAGLAISGAFSVGLVWEVGDRQRTRVLPSRLLEQLNSPGVQLYSLQRGGAAEAAPGIGAIDISTPEIGELARRLQMLDLCICPDTMVAHLSGALGCETWIMLQADCDWRWPRSGEKTFWYPTVRLFRQRTPGDWHDVVADVRSAVAARMRARDIRHGEIDSSGASGKLACCDR